MPRRQAGAADAHRSQTGSLGLRSGVTPVSARAAGGGWRQASRRLPDDAPIIDPHKAIRDLDEEGVVQAARHVINRLLPMLRRRQDRHPNDERTPGSSLHADWFRCVIRLRHARHIGKGMTADTWRPPIRQLHEMG